MVAARDRHESGGPGGIRTDDIVGFDSLICRFDEIAPCGLIQLPYKDVDSYLRMCDEACVQDWIRSVNPHTKNYAYYFLRYRAYVTAEKQAFLEVSAGDA